MLFTLLLLGCQENEPPALRTLYPEIAVTPGEVEFGDRVVPLPASTTFFVSNAGRVPLELSMAVEGDAAFVLPVTSGTIEGGEELEVEVQFNPTTFLDYAAELVLLSNDEETPELRVPATGRGVAGPLPDIDVDPGTIDFLTGPGQQILLIHNVGTAPLSIGRARLEGSGSFSLLTDPTDTVVSPGDSLPVVLNYNPPNPDGDNGRLILPSDDPDEAEVAVILLGNGGGDFEYPIAVIDCPGVTDPPRLVPLDGYGSSDPAGLLPLTYAWTLAAVPTNPSGAVISAATLSSLSGPATQLFADAVGTYEVDLVVTNAAGTRSAPARCFIDAIPDEQIVVELTWDTPNADLDVHLAQEGAALFQRPSDACWCNLAPDWGVAGLADDDARVDLDDRAGYGPENVNVYAPQDGQYRVRVHYFEDQGDTTVTATVRVYLLGELTPAFQASRLMDRNEVWDVALINWPEATVGALSADLIDAPRRTCFTP
jgi:hypothetical protein